MIVDGPACFALVIVRVLSTSRGVVSTDDRKPPAHDAIARVEVVTSASGMTLMDWNCVQKPI